METRIMSIIEQQIIQVIADILETEPETLSPAMPLVGTNGILDSIQLVSLCIALEDMAIAQGRAFDWTSEKALSPASSMFSSIKTLTGEFIKQLEAGS